MRAAARSAVLVFVILAGLIPDPVAADPGIPVNGLDRVVLDDGRVLDARVQPREGRVIPLEFPAGTIRVPMERVKLVRYFKDFDPAPRDAAEKEKTDQGYVRWEGRLMPPERWRGLREAELAEEARAREVLEASLAWSHRRIQEAGKFTVCANVPDDEFKRWLEILSGLSQKMLATFKGGDFRSTKVVLHLYRNHAAEKLQMEEDAKWGRLSRDFVMPNEPGRRVDVVLSDWLPDQQAHLVLGLAAIRLFDEMMGWRGDDLGGWVRCGVPLYFASASCGKGAFRIGEVDDDLLYAFRGMMQDGSLPDIEKVLAAGNSYWAESRNGGMFVGKDRSQFAVQYVPYCWLLVHFLLEGERGRYRGGLTNWLRFWTTTKIGSKLVEAAATWDAQKALFLKYLKLSDLKPLVDDLKAYAMEVDYRTAAMHTQVGSELLLYRSDPAEGIAHLEKAVEIATRAGDATALRGVGVAFVGVPGRRDRAIEVLRASLDIDPLSRETREVLGGILGGEEGERELKLAGSL